MEINDSLVRQVAEENVLGEVVFIDIKGKYADIITRNGKGQEHYYTVSEFRGELIPRVLKKEDRIYRLRENKISQQPEYSW